MHELARSILAAGLLHSVKVSKGDDAFTEKPYTRVLSPKLQVEFSDGWDQNKFDCTRRDIIKKYWELLGVSETNEPSVLIHIDEMGAYSGTMPYIEGRIDLLRQFWNSLYLSQRVQYYISSRLDDLSRIRKYNRSPGDVSPSLLTPLWLGTLDEENIT